MPVFIVIIEALAKPRSIEELLAQWKDETPLGPEDLFPEIADVSLEPEDIL